MESGLMAGPSAGSPHALDYPPKDQKRDPRHSGGRGRAPQM